MSGFQGGNSDVVREAFVGLQEVLEGVREGCEVRSSGLEEFECGMEHLLMVPEEDEILFSDVQDISRDVQE